MRSYMASMFILGIIVLGSFFSVNAQNESTSVLNASAISEYNIEFAQFTPEQVAQFHAFYVHYSGYQSHHLASQNLSNTKILYSTLASKALLLNNLQKTAEYLGLEVLVRSAELKISLQLMGVTPRNLPYKEWD